MNERLCYKLLLPAVTLHPCHYLRLENPLSIFQGFVNFFTYNNNNFNISYKRVIQHATQTVSVVTESLFPGHPQRGFRAGPLPNILVLFDVEE